MTEKTRETSTEAFNKLTHKWWETCAIDATGEYVWDKEIKAVNAMTDVVDEFPEWALQVRGAMPKYGFEMCSHRWLDGLDEAIHMIGSEGYWPSNAGRCGDVPGQVVYAAEQRAVAVESWLEGKDAPNREFGSEVAGWLGEPSPEKKEAATCFVELVRSFFEEPRPNEGAMERAKRWRLCSDKNEILAEMFKGEGFDSLLQNRCGFKIIDRLDIYIRLIGGDETRAADRHGVCNDQRRFIFPDDPPRLEVTRGYLWGLYAYLSGHDEDWLRANKPDCAGAAIYALQGVSQPGELTALQRWLVASLLKSTKLWFAFIDNTPNIRVPNHITDLPDILAAVKDY